MSKKGNSKNKKNKEQSNLHDFSFIRLMKDHLTLIVSILIPSTVYLIGFSYETGYLDEFGIPNDIFPNGIEHYFLQGFYVLSGALFSFVFQIKLWSILILFSILFYAMLSIEKIDSLRKLLNEKRKKKKKDNKEFTVKDYFSNLFFFSIFSFITPFVLVAYFTAYFLIFNELSNQYGESVAENIKEKYKIFHGCKDDKYHPYDCAVLNDKIRGAIISMQFNNIVLWDGKSAKLHILGGENLTFLNPIDKTKENNESKNLGKELKNE